MELQNHSQKQVDSPVSVFSEFQPLKTIVVGRSHPPEAYASLEDPEVREGLQQIARETEEDCLALSRIFLDYGAEVLRPTLSTPLYEPSATGAPMKRVRLSNGRWSTNFPTAPLWPRDLSLVLGGKIASVYSRSKARWIEGQSFYPIFREMYARGAKWVSMPPPLLDDAAESYAFYEGKELLYHAACFVRCGRDVFHTPPGGEIDGGRGTRLGLDWIQRQFPDFRFHAFRRPGHLDGKIAFLRPGLMLSTISREELPERLRSWEIVRIESRAPLPENFWELKRRRFYGEFVTKWLSEWIGNVDETYFDVNVVSLDEKTVVLTSPSPDLMRKLEGYGMTCIPFEFRHRHFWDGGLHCMTLDLKREGPREDYF